MDLATPYDNYKLKPKTLQEFDILGGSMVKEIEKKKRFLYRYKSAKFKAVRIAETMKEIRMYQMYPCVVSSGMPGSHNQKDLSDYMAKFDSILTQHIKADAEAISEMKTVTDCIDAMSDEKEKELLILKYIRLMDWNEIAVTMGYSARTIYRIHGQALANIEVGEEEENV